MNTTDLPTYNIPADDDREALLRIIRVMEAGGAVHTSGHDGEDDFDSTDMDEKKLIANLTACDSSSLRWEMPDGTSVSMWFVLGNEPFEVCADMFLTKEDDSAYILAQYATGEDVLPYESKRNVVDEMIRHLSGDHPWIPGALFNDDPLLAERLRQVIEDKAQYLRSTHA